MVRRRALPHVPRSSPQRTTACGAASPGAARSPSAPWPRRRWSGSTPTRPWRTRPSPSSSPCSSCPSPPASRFRLRFTARRVLPRFATAGEPISYRIVIENRTRRRRRGLTLLEEVPDPRPSLEEFLRADEGDDAADNWWDRRVGYARWQALITRNRAAEVAEHSLPPLPAGGVAEVRVELRPLRRGLLALAGVTVARPDPFGLVRGLRRVALPDTLLVLPRRYPVPPIQLAGTRKFQLGGVALASSVGDSEEFAALRDYRPGDPRRRIHWRSWARVGRPVVREHQDEFFARHALVLDTFAGGRPGRAVRGRRLRRGLPRLRARHRGVAPRSALRRAPRLLADRRPRAGPRRSAARGAGRRPGLPGRAVHGAAPARAHRARTR